MIEKVFFVSVLLLFLFSPTLVFAEPGHAPGTPHGVVSQGGTVHIHDDGTVEVHGASAFSLSTPWSPRWWTMVGVSLILMGFLSIWVNKYLQVQ
jgi:hypothetical protein